MSRGEPSAPGPWSDLRRAGQGRAGQLDSPGPLAAEAEEALAKVLLALHRASALHLITRTSHSTRPSASPAFAGLTAHRTSHRTLHASCVRDYITPLPLPPRPVGISPGLGLQARAPGADVTQPLGQDSHCFLFHPRDERTRGLMRWLLTLTPVCSSPSTAGERAGADLESCESVARKRRFRKCERDNVT